jgi:Ni/Co efflux regulator RcnB
MVRIGVWAVAAWIGTVPLVTSAAFAQSTGATTGTPVQPGSWGKHGWQSGAAPAPAVAPVAAAPVAPTYPHLKVGETLPQTWQSPSYTVSDWKGWGLAQPPAGSRWVRYYDDALLVDAAGKVADVRQDVSWARTTATPAAAEAPRVTTVRTSPNTVVTTETRTVPGVEAGTAYGGGQVASSTPGTITTTTTTTTEYRTVYKDVPVTPAKPTSRK